MTALFRRGVRELWDLFVDNGIAAGCVVGWVTLACVALRHNPLSAWPVGAWSGVILFAGLAAIFVLSTGRRDV